MCTRQYHIIIILNINITVHIHVSNIDKNLFFNYSLYYFDLRFMTQISVGNSMICSDIWHKYHE